MLLDKPISGARITIRDYQRADLPHMTAMWFDGENGKYLSDPTAEYVDELYQKALDELEDNPRGYYLTVALTDSQEIIGSACVFPDEKMESFDIGYCIRKDCWGRKFGAELIGLIVDWARGQGGLEITAEVARENVASIRLLVNSGFEILRKSEFKKYNMDICYESDIYRLRLSDTHRSSDNED